MGGEGATLWDRMGCEKYVDTADSREGEINRGRVKEGKRGRKSGGVIGPLKTRLHVRVGERESQTNRRGERK